MGPKVVTELLEVVADARKYDIYFDNFLIPLPLLEELKNMSLPATGKIGSNRAPSLSSPSNAEMKRKIVDLCQSVVQIMFVLFAG